MKPVLEYGNNVWGLFRCCSSPNINSILRVNNSNNKRLWHKALQMIDFAELIEIARRVSLNALKSPISNHLASFDINNCESGSKLVLQCVRGQEEG